jgi:arylsulfatase A-like enzyme
MTEPHLPVRQDHVPDEAYDHYHPDAVDPLPYLPDCRAVREDLADYDALVTATVDRAVGRVRDALDATGLTGETLLVFTTDHGIPFPRAKGTCYDSGLGTALLMAHPGRVEAGVTEDALLSNVDLLPTLLDYVGAEPPPVSGRSFAPLLGTGGEYEPRDRVFAEMTYHGDYHPMRAVRTREYKYVRNFGHGPTAYLPGDVYEMRSGRALHGEFYGREKRPEEECYDLADDPHERRSVAGGDRVYEEPEPADTDDADAVADLRAAVHDWMTRTGDPLVDGPVPLPADRQRAPFGSR